MGKGDIGQTDDVAAAFGAAQKGADGIAQDRDLAARGNPVEPMAAAATLIIMRLPPRQRLRPAAGRGVRGGKQEKRRACSQDELQATQRHCYLASPTRTAVEQ